MQIDARIAALRAELENTVLFTKQLLMEWNHGGPGGGN